MGEEDVSFIAVKQFGMVPPFCSGIGINRDVKLTNCLAIGQAVCEKQKVIHHSAAAVQSQTLFLWLTVQEWESEVFFNSDRIGQLQTEVLITDVSKRLSKSHLQA